MNLDQLKKGFFGYKKSGVYEYISEIEKDYSEKLTEKDQQQKKDAELYRARISELEEQLKDLTQKLEDQKREQTAIAATMIEATRFAENLRAQAQEQAKKDGEEWEKECEKAHAQLQKYRAYIKSVRETVSDLLRRIDQQSQMASQKIEATVQEVPGRNMSLFERKNGTEQQL